MRVAISFLLILAAFCSYGQKIRFTYPGNMWIVGDATPGGSYQRDYFYDTSNIVLHGNSYKKFYGSSDYVREDTVNGYVYYFDVHSDTDRVLYNYNWQVGDTIQYPNGSPDYSATDSVIGIDSVLIDSTWHRLWKMQGISSWGRYYTIVEGIGATTRPIDLLPCFEAAARLSCFLKDSLYPTFAAPYGMCNHDTGMFTNDSLCIPFYVRVPDLRHTPEIVLSPNPASDMVHLSIKETLKPANDIIVHAYDLLGNCIYSQNVNGRKTDHEIPVNNWPAGLYTIMIQGIDEKLVVRKVVIMR